MSSEIVRLENKTQEGVIIDPNELKSNEIDDMLNSFEIEFSNGFREYALSVIRERALPDIRDGLKPVHRRILYSMFNSGYTHLKTTYKSARIVGEIIGKYHPHGDTAVYETMVAMTQPWTYRYPLVYGQGNFGSIDGDSPAAMRYSEARLLELSTLYVNKTLRMDSVDFIPNYDEMETEPTVLPTQVPHLIINGGVGIAVGYSSGFMPHNLVEAMSLCIETLENRCLNQVEQKNIVAIDVIMKHLTGPDFATGGIVSIKQDKLRELYLNGRGSVSIKSRTHKEKLKNGKWQLIITEIPYFIKKEAMIVNISEQMRDGFEVERTKSGKKTNGLHLLIEDIRDETDKHGMRVAIVPRSSKIDFNEFRDHLFSSTPMQDNFSVNMNALVDGSGKHRIPRMLSMEDTLNGFLDFQDECVIRSSKFRLDKIIVRLHILDGFLIAFQNIKEIVEIIRTEVKPEPAIMRRFNLTKEQVTAIVELRLRRLNKISEDDIDNEIRELNKEKSHLTKMVEGRRYRIRNTIKTFEDIKDKYGDERRSTMDYEALTIKSMDNSVRVQKEAVSVIMTEEGWVKFVKGNVDITKTKLRSGSVVKKNIPCFTTDTVAFIGHSGRVYTTLVANLPQGRTEGSHISSLFDIGSDKILEVFIVDKKAEYTYIGDKGFAVRFHGEDVLSAQKKGKMVFSSAAIKDNVFVYKSEKHDGILFITSDNKMSVIKLAEFNVKTGGKGMQACKVPAGGQIKMARLVTLADKTVVTESDIIKIDLNPYVTARARAGKKVSMTKNIILITDVNT